jgi:hypothetical protein
MKTGFFEEMMRDYKSGVYNYTDNGRCTGCGDCCGRLLPLSKKEVKTIRRYVAKKKIQPHTIITPSMAPLLDMNCPFLDTTKEKDKCMIYDIRPDICRSFKCDNVTSDPAAEKRLMNKTSKVVDMWETFFPGEGGSLWGMTL